ncbi:uncharacterized protein [Palaemon carinicauda]|uniref:uncharacterized protein n=1 Tax=Palaemon carinicauda TaxID=392227 RepID=UPI0035B5A988
MVHRRKKKPQASAVVLRKYRRLRRHRGGLRCEYKKLKDLLPETTKAAQLKKVGVVEAAYRYICQLQDALLDKFSSKGVPEDLAGVVCGKVTSSSDIQALALHLIKTSGSEFPLPTSYKTRNSESNSSSCSSSTSFSFSSSSPPSPSLSSPSFASSQASSPSAAPSASLLRENET